MSSKRKGLRYSQKRLEYKREESANLRMKVLRSVLAVGVGFGLWDNLACKSHLSYDNCAYF